MCVGICCLCVPGSPSRGVASPHVDLILDTLFLHDLHHSSAGRQKYSLLKLLRFGDAVLKQ